MKRDKGSSESSYNFEATFAAGSIGINLQTTRSGIGTCRVCGLCNDRPYAAVCRNLC